jgi:hypothetical protein
MIPSVYASFACIRGTSQAPTPPITHGLLDLLACFGDAVQSRERHGDRASSIDALAGRDPWRQALSPKQVQERSFTAHIQATLDIWIGDASQAFCKRRKKTFRLRRRCTREGVGDWRSASFMAAARRGPAGRKKPESSIEG